MYAPNKTFDLIEMSPRLTADITNYVVDYEINKNIAATDYGLPVGGLVASTGRINLSKGFKEQIYNIFQFFHENIQVALFSATMPSEIITLTNKFLRNPVKIIMKVEELSLECIQQFYIAIMDDRSKYEMLKNLFSIISVSQCIIYCNSVKRVMDLYDAMVNENFSVCAIHSSMDKTEREKAFHSFRNGGYRVLISSNVTARGIDIQQVSFVINFDLPRDIHKYLHRIGRSGRWGRKGTSINFLTRRDIVKIKEIETYYCTQIEELPADFTFNN
jgi:translation initiation factor 4A